MADSIFDRNDDVEVSGVPLAELPLRLKRARQLRVQWRDETIGMLLSTEEWQRLISTLEAYEAQIAALTGDRAPHGDIPAWRPRRLSAR